MTLRLCLPDLVAAGKLDQERVDRLGALYSNVEGRRQPQRRRLAKTLLTIRL